MNPVMPDPMTNQPVPGLRRRYPLTTFLTAASALMLLLVMVIASLAYYRLAGFQHILSTITSGSLPAVVSSGRLFGLVHELTFLTEGLSHASNQVARRMMYQAIENKIAEIEELAAATHISTYQSAQLDTVIQELVSLNQLIDKRLQLQESVAGMRDELYLLHEKVLRSSATWSAAEHSDSYIAWSLRFSEMVVLADKALGSSKLHEIRQTTRKLHEYFRLDGPFLAELPAPLQVMATDFSGQLHSLLLAESGLLPMRAEQLRIAGRSIGRANFVRNLVLHYARIAEYEVDELSVQVLNDTVIAAEQVKKQIRLLGAVSVVAVLCVVVIIWFIQQRIARRLHLLNKNVLAELHGERVSLSMPGNDEISDISRSFSYFANKVRQQTQELELLSFTDGLTGLANRRAFDYRLEHDLQVAARHQWPFSLLLIDVDFFKPYNDNYGHLAGDHCLQQVAELLQGCIRRNNDFIARYGGEEFVCILPDVGTQGAGQIADNMLQAVRSAAIRHEFSKTAACITVSVGIVSVRTAATDDGNRLLALADEALYQAKAQGRNCYKIWRPL